MRGRRVTAALLLMLASACSPAPSPPPVGAASRLAAGLWDLIARWLAQH